MRKLLWLVTGLAAIVVAGIEESDIVMLVAAGIGESDIVGVVLDTVALAVTTVYPSYSLSHLPPGRPVTHPYPYHNLPLGIMGSRAFACIPLPKMVLFCTSQFSFAYLLTWMNNSSSPGYLAGQLSILLQAAP